MNVGIVCYASIGGSGIVATELAKGLARRGHEVRLISSEPPVRLGDFQAGLAFHAVRTPGYPLFREPQYLLTLANKIVEVCREGPGSTSSTPTTRFRMPPQPISRGRSWPLPATATSRASSRRCMAPTSP